MIATVRGKVLSIEANSIIIECGGIGYEVLATAAAIGSCPGVGNEMMLYTYLQVKEDGVALFGFATKDEKQLFEKLISVSGVGPKGALAVLSHLGAEGLMVAIVTEDAKSISKAPGLGSKTAQKIIIELKDKINASEVLTAGVSAPVTAQISGSAAVKDVCMALTALGFREAEIMSAIKSIKDADKMDADSLLAAALKKFG